MGRFKNRLMAMALGCVALSGCATLEPKADPSRFFTLAPVSAFEQSDLEPSSFPGVIAIGVGPINFPGYLDREQIVTRVSQNRFQVAENDRWVEPLQENFARVLLENLTALLPTAHFMNYPWRLNERPRYQLAINLMRFEPNADGHVELVARWILREIATKQPAPVKETRLSLPVKGTSTDAAVAALSGAVGDLSREIAQAVAFAAKAAP
ncbi:MAG TPA: PqiC family protein [Terriglobales bacterium]|nr:PqiC family protein [Terriglobales bacterium]